MIKVSYFVWKGGDNMKKKLIVISIVVACFALTAGIVNAATERNITKKLGGVKGDTFSVEGRLNITSLKVNGTSQFRGAISNPTGDVVFGDNVRIDGRVYRGAPNDSQPFIVNDSMQVNNNLTVKGSETIDGNLTVAGTITAATMQQLIGGGVSTTGKLSMTVAAATTWTGTIYDVATNSLRTSDITVTFTPASSTTGTWTSNPVNIFNLGLIMISDSDRGTYSGSYTVIDNLMFATNVTKPDHSSTVVGYTTNVDVRGNTITFVDTASSPKPYAILTR
jgi:hypothetical protein